MKKRKDNRLPAGWYLFHIQSNRGTNDRQFFYIRQRLTQPEMQEKLEKWCEQFGAWTHGDNVVNYNWKKCDKPNLPKLWRERVRIRRAMLDADRDLKVKRGEALRRRLWPRLEYLNSIKWPLWVTRLTPAPT